MNLKSVFSPATKSWKTTLRGALTAGFLVVGPHLKDPSKPWVDLSTIPAALAASGLGALAGDHKDQ